MYYLQLVQLESWVYLYHSWFSLDGVSDFGVVTLACDDDKRIQAHEVYLAKASLYTNLDCFFFLLYVGLARLVQPILARLLLLLMIVNQIRHTDPGLGTCLRFWSFCIPSSWIQLGSWVGNLFQVLVLLYSF